MKTFPYLKERRVDNVEPTAPLRVDDGAPSVLGGPSVPRRVLSGWLVYGLPTVLLSLCCPALLHAQAAGGGQPTLHQRTEQTYGDVRSRKNPQVPSTLPSEASGEYLMGKPGDVIEIILDSNGLTGYISMIGKTDKDKDAALTYFFDDTQLDAKSLSFTTRPVHGAYYSFQGTIVRGAATTRSKEGYYLLQGTLTLHNTADRSEAARRVALPLARTIDGQGVD